MPSEQSPAHNPGSTRQGPAEQHQHPPSRGGARMLLGLPFSDHGAPSTGALTAPSGRHRYGQSSLPAPEGSDESFGETAPDEGGTEEAREAVADFPVHDSAPFARARRENATDARQALTPPSAEQREQTRLAIPGVSTHRTAFPALSQTADTPTLSMGGEPLHAIPPPATPLNAPVSLPQAREVTTSDVELLTRLEQLVTEGARAQKGSEARSGASAPLPPGPLEQIGMQNGERAGQDLAQRLEQLQRTVRELAATVASQAPPPQRTVIITRSDASSTTPRAFLERSRLGRFHLKTGR